MKYSDLISFDPLETVIQLKDSDDEEKARNLIKTFVISPDLAKRYSDIIIQQLQFEQPVDNKGVLIVGNYGSGKSHFMSVISSIAQYPGIFTELQNEDAKEQSKKIDGKFKVLRIEIGAVTTSLRDIICTELETFLQDLDIDFKFKDPDKIKNNKSEFERMMGTYQVKFPKHGLLLVVDEMLDYLQGRNNLQLFSDFNFLREVAEFCKSSKFRFIAGLQQSLFDNPSFSNAANLLKKFKDRFEQILMLSNDIDYVVKNRLLKKSADQKVLITKHLDKFKKQFSILSNNFQDFVDLFPISPAYTETLNQLAFVEKRRILKNISLEIKNIFENEVPTDEPGIISFDSYWNIIANDPVNLSDENITKTMKASKVLETKVNNSLDPTYKDIGLRIIRGLSVYRLTDPDITTPMGLKAEDLKDKLLLFDKVSAQQNSLSATIYLVLTKIHTVTDGSYITQNKNTEEWYVDVDATVNYEEKINQQAGVLADEKIDDYFYDVLQHALEIERESHVQGLKVWPSEINWAGHNTTRDGYLFFGTPNERDTAHPPKQFYLYFLPFFRDPQFDDEKNDDEVFFKFKNLEDKTIDIIKKYAGARDLELNTAQPARGIYRQKADAERKMLVEAINQERVNALQVTYQGQSKSLKQIPTSTKGASVPFADSIKSVASSYLKDTFDANFPKYPTFTQTVTKANISEYFNDTIKKIVTNTPFTKTSRILLDGLKLLDDDGKIDPTDSNYAKWFKSQLDTKGPNIVLNKDEIIETVHEEELDKQFRIELEMVVIVLASLVYNGDIVLGYPGKKITAENISDMANFDNDSLLQFTNISKPTGIPVVELVTLFTLLDLQPSRVKSEKTLDTAATELQNKISLLLEQITHSQERLLDGTTCFGKSILDENNRDKTKQSLEKLKEFCDSLSRYDSAAKLKMFKKSKDEINAQKENLDRFKKINQITTIISELQPLTDYLTTAQRAFSPDDELFKKIETAKEQTSTDLKKSTSDYNETIKKPLQKLKDEYIQKYYDLHNTVRLDSIQNNKLTKLYNDKKYKKLISLTKIDILDSSEFTSLQTQLNMLKPCSELTKDLLRDTPQCRCQFDPSVEVDDSGHVLLDIHDKIDEIEDKIKESLFQNMSDPSAIDAIKQLTPNERKSIEGFLKNKSLPDEIEDTFIQIINRALSGLKGATINVDELKSGLQEGGMPCTYDDIQDRFKKILDEKSRDKGPSKTRFKIE